MSIVCLGWKLTAIQCQRQHNTIQWWHDWVLCFISKLLHLLCHIPKMRWWWFIGLGAWHWLPLIDVHGVIPPSHSVLYSTNKNRIKSCEAPGASVSRPTRWSLLLPFWYLYRSSRYLYWLPSYFYWSLSYLYWSDIYLYWFPLLQCPIVHHRQDPNAILRSWSIFRESGWIEDSTIQSNIERNEAMWGSLSDSTIFGQIDIVLRMCFPN